MLKKTSFIFSLLCLIVLSIQAQGLKFHDGQFKIVQFTDLHYQPANPASQQAIDCIKEVIGKEKPDLIIVTGDIIYARPGNTALQSLLNLFSSQKTPFCMILGNHDPQQGTSATTLYDMMQKTPYDIQPVRRGNSLDYVLPVKSENGLQTEALIYCFDTHSFNKIPDVGGYREFSFSQLSWYRSTSTRYTKANRGKPLPAIAFMHYPLPEYNEAVSNPQVVMYGIRMERAYAPKLNSGMFAAMKECGDVMGVFCGHDHDDDYSLMYYHVLLAHGRFSGGNTVYNHLRNGARVIVLKEGQRSLDTWIRERGGQVVDKTSYPSSYTKDNWKLRNSTH
ncbi:MAG: metallophosphoesterase family protein [Prevotella sp.]|jgi:3',5'-cyclic AMP phosphodiesterase CpdA|nr:MULTISPECIES: metallophosphoesterase family protein [unclassified Prevotella]MCH3969239.1 metallophosphoesterase family protein [Prevotella sp.]MCH3985419.1 metallophosphoesterase family protein [Prevotella sp.]MCH3991912.1 metallophosphoesterase family protein [Prevotella sp.]MCH4017520.1 metallophosphoesterase family protein [Prevotella sp.]MCH4185273.1 metallophosphoesterase family protein [Prevotella sp.]